jgi:hypothetical protein
MNDTLFVLDSTLKANLYALADYNDFPGTYARNILSFYDTLVYLEPHITPSDQEKRGEVRQNKKKNTAEMSRTYRIYPNPALSYFVAEYSMASDQKNTLVLRICDLYGSVLQEIELSAQSDHKVISTKEFNSGLYLCNFVVNGSVKETIKLAVIR